MEKMFDPGTSKGRFRTLLGLEAGVFADARAEELDLVASDEDVPDVGRWRASGKANRDEDVGECSTDATPGGGDWIAIEACAGSAAEVVVVVVEPLPPVAEGFLLMTGEA